MSDLVVRTIADPTWHTLLSRHEPYFHQLPEWFGHLAATFRGEGIAICLEEKAGPVACLPAFLLRTPPLKVVFAGIPYGDVLGPPELEDELLRAISKERKLIPADQLRYVPYRRRPELPSFFDKTEERIITELRLPIGGPGELKEGMPGIIRRQLRKSNRKGIAAKPSGEDSGATLHRFYAQTMRRKKASCRYPESWFRSLAGATHPAPRIEKFLASGLEGPVAMIITATSGGVAHVIHAASAAAGLSTGAPELLHFTAIERAVAAGAQLVDFGASDPEDEGLRVYKRKFGGEERVAPVGVMHLRPIRSRLADLARTWAGTRTGAWLLSLSRPSPAADTTPAQSGSPPGSPPPRDQSRQ